MEGYPFLSCESALEMLAFLSVRVCTLFTFSSIEPSCLREQPPPPLPPLPSSSDAIINKLRVLLSLAERVAVVDDHSATPSSQRSNSHGQQNRLAVPGAITQKPLPRSAQHFYVRLD